MPQEIVIDHNGEKIPLSFADDVPQDLQDAYIKKNYPAASMDRSFLGNAAVGPVHGLASAAAGTVRSAKLLADAPTGTPLSNLVDVTASKLDDIARKFQGDESTKGFKPFNPEWLAFNIGSAAGSFIPGAATTVAASLLGTPLAGAAVAGGIVGAAAEVGGMHQELLDKGVDKDVADTKSLQFGAAVALLQSISLGKIASKGGPGLLGLVKKGTTAGLTEAATEALEEPISDAIQGNPWTMDTLRRMGAVAVPSFFVGGGAAVVAGGRFDNRELEDAPKNILEQMELDGALITDSIIPEKRDALLREMQARGEISKNTMSLEQWNGIINEPTISGGVPRAKTILARLKAQEVTVSKDDFLNLEEILRIRDDPKVTKRARQLHPDTALENILDEQGIGYEDAIGNDGFTAEQWNSLREAFGSSASNPDLMVAFYEQMMANSLRGTGTSVRQLMNEHFGGTAFGKEVGAFQRPKDAPDLNVAIDFVEAQEVEQFAVPSLLARMKQDKTVAKQLKDSQLEFFLENKSTVSKSEVVGRLKGIQREGFVRGETTAVKDPQGKNYKPGMKYLLRGMTAQDATTGVHEVAHFIVLTSRGPFRALIEKQTGKKIEKWNTKDHESFVSGLERYLYNNDFSKGAFENQELFDYVKSEFKLAYADVKDIMEGMIHEELRMAYDQMLGYDLADVKNGETFVQDINETIDPEPVPTTRDKQLNSLLTKFGIAADVGTEFALSDAETQILVDRIDKMTPREKVSAEFALSQLDDIVAENKRLRSELSADFALSEGEAAIRNNIEIFSTKEADILLGTLDINKEAPVEVAEIKKAKEVVTDKLKAISSDPTIDTRTTDAANEGLNKISNALARLASPERKARLARIRKNIAATKKNANKVVTQKEGVFSKSEREALFKEGEGDIFLEQGPNRSVREQLAEGSSEVWNSDAAGIATDARLVRSSIDNFKKGGSMTPGEWVKLVQIEHALNSGMDLFPGSSIIEDLKSFENLSEEITEVLNMTKREAGLGLQRQKIRKALSDVQNFMADAGLELSEEQRVTLMQAIRLIPTDPAEALRQVQAFQRKDTTPRSKKAGAFAMSIFYQSMLSNPATHAVNIGSNVLMQNYLAADRVAQGTIDAIWSNVTGKTRTVYANEGLDVFRAFGRAFTGQDSIANKAFMDSLKGISRDSDVITKTEEEMGLLINNVVEDVLTKHFGKSGNWLAKRLTTPTRYLIAADVWFKAVAEQGQEAAVIRRFNQLPEGVATGEKVKFIQEQFQNIRIADARLKRVYDITPEALGQVTEAEIRNNVDKYYAIAVKNSSSLFAEHATFQDKAGNFTRSLINLRNNTPLGLGRVLVPFIQTQTNIAKRGIELTPGLGVGAKLAGVSTANWNEIVTKQVEGALIAGSIWGLIASEVITGAPPEDKAERESFFRRGLQPYSVNVNGTWYSYRRLEPLSFPISMIATIVDQIQNAPDDMTKLEKFTQASLVARDHIIDGTFMSGMRKNLGTEPQAKRQLMWMTSSLVPYSGLWRGLNKEYEAATTGQVLFRENRTFMDTFGQSIPSGVANIMGWTAAPRRDAFGDVIARDSNWWREWMPVRFQTQVADKVEETMASLQVYPGMPGKNVSLRPGAELVEMPSDIYNEYLIQYGLRTKERIGQIIEKESFSAVNVQRQRKIVEKQLDTIRASELKKAKRKMLRRQREGVLE
jgi:hypothetical protein